MSGSHEPSNRLRDALRELAQADAQELIAAARERARARAEKVIEDALVDELLNAAAQGRSTERAERGTDTALWAYCVLSAADAAKVPSDLEGIEPGTTVEVLCEGELGALISAVPAGEYNDVRLREHLEDLAWVERTARRHEAVLEEILTDVAIVPLRLCTIYRGVEGVRRLLSEHARSLARSLATVDGCAEWGVKLFADTSAPTTEPEPELSASGERPGATYLVARQREREHAERVRERRAACADAVHERVSKVARQARSNPPQRAELHGREMAMLLNGAYLVANDRVEQLRETVNALAAEWRDRGFEIELTGPWPAYNFVAEAGVVP